MGRQRRKLLLNLALRERRSKAPRIAVKFVARIGYQEAITRELSCSDGGILASIVGGLASFEALACE